VIPFELFQGVLHFATHYEVLGVSRDADAKTIKSAFLKVI
jgi:curved DNA-binding protein CbpA